MDDSLWVSERFVREVEAVVAGLGLDRFHVLGQSWGSMLATDYALAGPSGLASLILASPPLSIPRWLVDCADYRAALPERTRAILDREEAAGTTDSPEYEAATMVFYQRHVCRLDPWPRDVNEAMAGMGTVVYHTMWGPNEFNMSGGRLDSYDRTPDLHRLGDWPVLFTCGRFDEATPDATAWYRSLVPGAEIAVFERSSHMPHVEERDAYMATVRDFLRRADAQVQPERR
jgi:proline iminopeptidase